MKAEQLIAQLKRKLSITSEGKLADYLGMTSQALTLWKKNEVTPLQVANAIIKASEKARKDALHAALKPIIEFYPIDPVQKTATSKEQWVFNSNDTGRYTKGLRTALEKEKSGLYIFYDTRGRALYAGHTKAQNLWKELNNAFNRERSNQTFLLVTHPTNDVEFKPASDKVRQPSSMNLKLSTLAAYFSAYAVDKDIVDDLEALLIRTFPNDLLNLKMEKFGKAKKRAKKSA